MSARARDDNGQHMILCPGCVAIHAIDSRWTFNGNYERPTFTPSLLVTCEYGDDRERRLCHSFITDGRIQFLGDCTHALKGQTVDLPEWEKWVWPEDRL